MQEIMQNKKQNLKPFFIITQVFLSKFLKLLQNNLKRFIAIPPKIIVTPLNKENNVNKYHFAFLKKYDRIKQEGEKDGSRSNNKQIGKKIE